MNVQNVRIERSGIETILRATVRAKDAAVDGFELECIWQGLDPEIDLCVGDALLAFLLRPAMVCGEPLDLGPHTVSTGLIGRLDVLQDLYVEWSHGLTRTQVTAPHENREVERDGTALFFSGGVDSWYSALTCGTEGFVPSHILFLIGFDMAAEEVHRVAQTQEVAERVARDRGATLVVSRSNLRELSDPLLDWRLYHGCYMTGVALAIGGEISSCLIPSSLSPDSVNTTWGSHPDLDPMWGTEALEFVHSGFEFNRIDKTRRIAEDDFALSTLRVCWQPKDVYNCGHCAKCSLAMAVLRVLDKLEEAESFPDSVDLKALASNDAHFAQSEPRTVIRALLPMAEAKGDFELARALRKTFRPKHLRPYKYARFARRRLKGAARPRASLNLMTPYDQPRKSGSRTS